MTKERLGEVLDNLIGWAMDHSREFLNDFIAAAGFTKEELYELDLEEDYEEVIEEEDCFDRINEFFQSILETLEQEEDEDLDSEEV